MAAQFEIWDNDTAIFIFAYPTMQDALADVRDETAMDGPEAVQPWMLQCNDGVRPRENIAMGIEPIRYATESAIAETDRHD